MSANIGIMPQIWSIYNVMVSEQRSPPDKSIYQKKSNQTKSLISHQDKHVSEQPDQTSQFSLKCDTSLLFDRRCLNYHQGLRNTSRSKMQCPEETVGIAVNGQDEPLVFPESPNEGPETQETSISHGPFGPIHEEQPPMKVPVGDLVIEKRNYTKIGATNRIEWTSVCDVPNFLRRRKHCQVDQQQITVFEERTAQPMTDGTTEYGEWRVISTLERWVRIVDY